MNQLKKKNFNCKVATCFIALFFVGNIVLMTSLPTKALADSPRPFLNSAQHSLLDEISDTTLNYFLSTDAVTASGMPLSAYKEGDRARYGYSNPTEWGYTILAWIVAAERKRITYDQAGAKIQTALTTISSLQNNPAQNYHKLFYPYYTVVNSSGVNLSQPVHSANHDIPSIDNGFLYTSLLIAEGWAIAYHLPNVQNAAHTIKGDMDFRRFLKPGGDFIAHTVNTDTGAFGGGNMWNDENMWNVYSDEGGMMAWIAYISDSVSQNEYQTLINNMRRLARSWNGIEVKEAAWFNAMFTWGVRSLSGFPVATWEAGTENRYSSGSFAKAVKAHLSYGAKLGVYYPAFSDAMTQPGGVAHFFPPNFPDNAPASAPNFSVPHAFFIPFNIGPDLDATDLTTLISKIIDLKTDTGKYYHNGNDTHRPYGFEVTTSPSHNNTNFFGLEGRYVWENLSQAYILLSLFQGLSINDGKPTLYQYAGYIPGYQNKVKEVLSYLYPPIAAGQRIIHVPADYATIQAAIDAAKSGDIIQVAAGTYKENIVLNKSGITLQGDNQASIIQGSGPQTVLAQNISGEPTIIQDFKIMGADIGIKCLGTVKTLVIKANDLTSAGSTGINLEANAVAQIEHNHIALFSHCIMGDSGSVLNINGNALANCRGSYGGGIILSQATATIKNNSITQCWDGAIILDKTNAAIIGNKISYNDAWDASPSIRASGSDIIVAQNLIFLNSTHNGSSGAGLNAYGGDANIYNNIFGYNNFGFVGGAGAAIFFQGNHFEAKNNIFVGNGSTSRETIWVQSTSNPIFSYNLIGKNSTTSEIYGFNINDTATYPGNIHGGVDPKFSDSSLQDTSSFSLASGSPGIDAGDPGVALKDRDSTRSDIGIYGGPVYQKTLPVAPAISGIPSQSVSVGQAFQSIYLDTLVSNPDNLYKELTWNITGQNKLSVSMSKDHVVTVAPIVKDWIGSEDLTFRVTDPGGLTDVSPVVFTVLPVMTFEKWQVQKFTPAQLGDPNISGANADPNKNKIPNIFEYAFNLNPLAVNTSTGLQYSLLNNHFTINFRKNISASDLTFRIGVKSDLISPWAYTVLNSPTAQDAFGLSYGSIDSMTQSVNAADKTDSTTVPMRFFKLEAVKSSSQITTLSLVSNPAQARFTLSVAKSGAGDVTSSSKGIRCGTTCQEDVLKGTSEKLVATPAKGYTFNGWSGACAGAQPGMATNGCAVTADSLKKVGVSFKAISPQVTTPTKG